MKRTLSIWTLMAFLAALLITSCGPATPVDEPAQDGTVNLVEQAGLDKTVAIEIAVLAAGMSGESGAEAPGYVSQLTITDPGLVDQIVAALDTALELGPKARCPNGYELRFHQEDGTVQTFGYACGSRWSGLPAGGTGFLAGPAGLSARRIQRPCSGTTGLCIRERGCAGARSDFRSRRGPGLLGPSLRRTGSLVRAGLV